MALVLNDRVKQTSTTTGTGAMTFASAVTRFETFAQGIGNSNTTYYGIFNVGTGQAETFNKLATHLLTALDKKPHIDYFDMPEKLRPKYQYFTQADISKLRSSGYKDKIASLEEGIADYIHYLTAGQATLGY